MLHFLAFLKIVYKLFIGGFAVNVASKCNTKIPSGVSVLRKAVMCLVGENMNVG